MKRLLLCLLLIPLAANAADGIKTNTKFKVPFTVDGKDVINRAEVTVAGGKSTLTVTYVKNQEIERKAYTLTAAEDPTPTPVPPPTPTPTPVPVEKLWGVVIYESSAQTPAQAVVLLSAKVRKLFADEQFRAIDKDTETSAQWKPYVDAGKGKALPYLFLVDAAGTIHFEGPFPGTVADAVALITPYVKGTAK